MDGWRAAVLWQLGALVVDVDGQSNMVMESEKWIMHKVLYYSGAMYSLNRHCSRTMSLFKTTSRMLCQMIGH